MVITYGTRTLFKREGAWGHAICKNCGHDAPQTLCRQLDQVTLFFIPIVSLEKQRGILCESCGMIVPLDKAEYKRRREAVSRRRRIDRFDFTGGDMNGSFPADR